jgi:cytochrome P450
MEPLTISIILVLITLSLYHGIHIEFYNFFYLNSGFQGPKSVMERLRVARDLFDQKDFYERYWTPRSEIIKVFISPFTPSMYCVSDAALARNILQDSTMFARPERPSQIMKGIVDYALFILPTDGPYWKKHRKLLQPGFGPTHLRHTGSVTVKVMDKLSGLWNNRLKTSTDTITVNMKNVLGCIAMDVIGMVAFGKDLKMVDQLATNDDPRWQALETITSGYVFLGQSFDAL